MAKITQPGRNSVPGRAVDDSAKAGGKKERRQFTLPPASSPAQPARDQLQSKGLAGVAQINTRLSTPASSAATAQPAQQVISDATLARERKMQHAVRDEVSALVSGWGNDAASAAKLAHARAFVAFAARPGPGFDAMSAVLGMSFRVDNLYQQDDRRPAFMSNALMRLNPPEAGRAILEEMGEFVGACISGQSRPVDLDLLQDFNTAFVRLEQQSSASRDGKTADSPLREAHAWVDAVFEVVGTVEDAIAGVQEDELDARRSEHSLLDPANLTREAGESETIDDPDFADWDYEAEESFSEGEDSEIESPANSPAMARKENQNLEPD